jgi:hypothetical protein
MTEPTQTQMQVQALADIQKRFADSVVTAEQVLLLAEHLLRISQGAGWGYVQLCLEGGRVRDVIALYQHRPPWDKENGARNNKK